MRKLSDDFMLSLQTGFLHGLLAKVQQDTDLDLEIRENYLNIYFKGNSLLKLGELDSGRYRPTVHPKFTGGKVFPIFEGEQSVMEFLDLIPWIKENIIQHGKSSIETEYEQMIIRANNYEWRNNSEYFIVDRQYSAGFSGRFDLTGFYWPRTRRRKRQEVPICLIEIKYTLNQDIQDLDEQVTRYYEFIKANTGSFKIEVETIFRQKLQLGLFRQAKDRLEALETLTFTSDIDQFQFLVILVDYNPYSKHLDLTRLKALPFANQVMVYSTGFALWKKNLSNPLICDI